MAKRWHEQCYLDGLNKKTDHSTPRINQPMKTTTIIATMALALVLSATLPNVANATAFQISATGAEGPGHDIAKNGTGPAGGNGNSAADNFFRLANVVTGYNAAPGPHAPLPTPVSAGSQDLGAVGGTTINTTGFSYVVLHYGVGNGGVQASGGGVEFFYLNGMTTFAVPANGTGPNGFGGYSSGTLFGPGNIPNVPDGGSTIMLLGAALGGLGAMRRLVRR